MCLGALASSFASLSKLTSTVLGLTISFWFSTSIVQPSWKVTSSLPTLSPASTVVLAGFVASVTVASLRSASNFHCMLTVPYGKV